MWTLIGPNAHIRLFVTVCLTKLICSLRCLGKDFSGDKQCEGDHPYRSKYKKDVGYVCQEKEKSCKGQLCRCDVEYVQSVIAIKNQFNPSNHVDFGFDRIRSCSGKAKSSKGKIPKLYETVPDSIKHKRKRII